MKIRKIEQIEWTFFGRVLPERVPVSVTIDGMRMLRGTLNLRIYQSQIIISLKTTDTTEEAYTLRNTLDALVRSIMDLIGYERGLSFDVELISCLNSRGNSWSFGNEIPILYEKKGNPTTVIDGDTYNLYHRDDGVYVALSDFREAMRVPMQTGFFCYRAVEAMMQTMKVSATEKESLAWERLRSVLHIDKPALDYIKGHADWARHGKTGAITDSERAQLFLLTDEIIGRYLRYVRGARAPLSAAQTPLLSFP